jgi:hypothetical protein
MVERPAGCSMLIRYATRTMSPMATDSLWNRVHDVWRRSKIVIRRGASQDDIAAFEAKYGVVLPPDVRAYFIAADGTGDDMDEGLYRFWPLAEVQPVHDVLVSERFTYSDRFSYSDCFAFADHCINCWEYAVRLTKDAKQPAPVFRVTGGDPPGEQMTASFREFMEQYADNPNNVI